MFSVQAIGSLLGFGLILPFTTILIVLYYICRTYLMPFMSPMKRIPCPRQSLGLLNFFSEPRVPEIEKWVDTVPNNGLIRYFGSYNRERIFAASPDAVRDLLSTNAYKFIKPKLQHTLAKNIAAEGLLIQEGDVHKAARKNVGPAFHISRIRREYPSLWETTGELLGAISSRMDREEAPMNIMSLVSGAHIDAIGNWAFSTPLNAMKDEKSRFARSYINMCKTTRHGQNALQFAALTDPNLIMSLPLRLSKTIRGVMQFVRKTAEEIVDKHVQRYEADYSLKGTNSIPSMDDMLTAIIKTKHFSRHDLVEQTVHFLAAATQTTSGTMMWVLHLLSRHPNVQKRLREEIHSNLPAPDSGRPISHKDFEGMKYLNAVLREVLRFHSINTLLWRECIEDAEIQGVNIPKGTIVVYSPWTNARDPVHWGEDARTFNPDRWLDEGKKTGGADHPYSFITFGAGPRRCIGEDYAFAILRTVIAGLVGRFELQPLDFANGTDEGQEIGDDNALTLFKVIEGWKLSIKKVDW